MVCTAAWGGARAVPWWKRMVVITSVSSVNMYNCKAEQHFLWGGIHDKSISFQRKSVRFHQFSFAIWHNKNILFQCAIQYWLPETPMPALHIKLPPQDSSPWNENDRTFHAISQWNATIEKASVHGNTGVNWGFICFRLLLNKCSYFSHISELSSCHHGWTVHNKQSQMFHLS